MTEFIKLWNQYHRGRRPIGLLLGPDGAKHRFRFDALSGPIRYSNISKCRDLLLAWQNLLAAAALGEAPCWLVQCHRLSSTGFADIANASDPICATRQYGLPFGFEFLVHEYGGETRWRAHAVETTWFAGKYDALLLDIAEGRAAPTLWVSSGSGAIFAPSENGIDLYLTSKSDVDVLTDALAAERALALGS